MAGFTTDLGLLLALTLARLMRSSMAGLGEVHPAPLLAAIVVLVK